ncbi:hypothetical protein OCGS_0545 [Oceaniovalibus guishaninsula JLT2003]|uniref:Uncharacterized protein n=2 Tax=Oceaniovalibus TaxID=1207070 RepID=K2I8W3_9RHOB|nr:hypothetical protein OCGS_0545 [Oceaniovalibus guishaninsula JLT2003]
MQGYSDPGQDMTRDQQRARQQQAMAFEMELERFGQDVYERAFRQGYLRGVADARRSMMQQQMQQDQERQMRGDRGQRNNMRQQLRDQMQQPQQHGQMMQGQQQGQMQQGNPPISGEVAARPGGSIIVLPEGVDPQAFIDRLMRDQQNQSN